MTSLFKKINSEPNHSFPYHFVTKVNQLSAFDMIYIYHHIQEGSKLNLVQQEKHLNGDLDYKVMYKSFHLGFIRVSNFLKYDLTNITFLTAVPCLPNL